MPNWLTTAQVADRIHRNPCTVRRAAELGELHGHQPMRDGRPVRGGRWSFAESAVDAFVQNLDDRAQRDACGCARLRRR
jgi:hypothetical protein